LHKHCTVRAHDVLHMQDSLQGHGAARRLVYRVWRHIHGHSADMARHRVTAAGRDTMQCTVCSSAEAYSKLGMPDAARRSTVRCGQDTVAYAAQARQCVGL